MFCFIYWQIHFCWEGDCYSKLIHSLLIKSLKMNHLKCDSSGSLSYKVPELKCFESKENFLLRKGFYFTEKKSSLVKAASYCSKSKYCCHTILSNFKRHHPLNFGRGTTNAKKCKFWVSRPTHTENSGYFGPLTFGLDLGIGLENSCGSAPIPIGS